MLRHVEVGEADRILTIYTLEYGKLQAIAKGIRKLRSRKAGHLEPFSRVELMLAKGRNLDVISQAEAQSTYENLRADLKLIAYGACVIELLDRFTYEEGENGLFSASGAVVLTVAGDADALEGTENGAAKVTPLEMYPMKGRGTGGVRCQRFLKGEDVLQLAWVGATPAVAAAASGSPIELPAIDARRDASGTSVGQPIAAVSTRYHA